MSSRTKHPVNNLPTSEPSPWTEPFQQTQAAKNPGKKSETAGQTQAASKPEDRPDEATSGQRRRLSSGLGFSPQPWFVKVGMNR